MELIRLLLVFILLNKYVTFYNNNSAWNDLV